MRERSMPSTMESDEGVQSSDEGALERYEFGGPVARRAGGTFGNDCVGESVRDEPLRDSSLDGRRNRADLDYRQKLQSMDFDARCKATAECINRRGTFRDILYGLLGFCAQERTYEEIGPFVESFVEFQNNRQESHRYVFMLLRTGGLCEIELDEDGVPLTEEKKQRAIEQGLDPEDIDTLVFDWHVVTTDVGERVYEELAPARRLKALLKQYPEREEAFAQIMMFCREPKTMGSIDAEFKGTDLLGIDESSKLKRQPSSYIEKLGAVGAIAWSNGAWILTDVGREYLDRYMMD